MMAAAVKKEEVEAGSCPLYRCFCCWRRACSPRIPRVAPGMDYLCIPAGADNSPAWSLLVGFLSNSNSTNDSGLGLHRFRVARSGRILGRSDDALDILRTLRTIKGCSAIASVSAELTPDGCSLCLFSEHLDPGKAPAIPRANELRVTYNMKEIAREYEDKDAVKPSMQDYPTSSHVIEESSKMLDCCSTFLSELGCDKFEDPPKDPAL